MRTSAGGAGLYVAWLAACAPLVLPWIVPGGPERFAGVSALALAAVAPVAWIGAPRTIEPQPGARSELGPFAVLLPPVLAAAGWDLAQGSSAPRVAAILLGALAAAALLALAARRAAECPRAARVHALAWFALVALAPLAAFALGEGGAPFLGEAPRALGILAGASPPGWLAAHAADVGGALRAPWAPLLAAAGPLLAAELARVRADAA